jgi:hypothetical protein
LNQYTQFLVDRLEKKGIETNVIPGLMRSLASTMALDPDMGLFQLNNHLRFLGWDGFELDYHTLELATACFEADGLIGGLEDEPPRWAEFRR